MSNDEGKTEDPAKPKNECRMTKGGLITNDEKEGGFEIRNRLSPLSAVVSDLGRFGLSSLLIVHSFEFSNSLFVIAAGFPSDFVISHSSFPWGVILLTPDGAEYQMQFSRLVPKL